MKKLLSLFLALALLAACSVQPYDDTTLLQRVGRKIHGAQKSGHTDAADGPYTLGAGVPAYLYKDGRFSRAEGTYYPLYQSQELIAMLITWNEDASGPQYEPIAAFGTLAQRRESLAGCTLIFDAEACWLYDGTALEELYTFDLVTYRDRLNSSTPIPRLDAAADAEPQEVTVPTDFDLRWG